MLVVLAAVLCFPAPVRAQGCILCRDDTAGSAPKVREGLRRGILVLGVPAGLIFVGILAVAFNTKPRDEDRE